MCRVENDPVVEELEYEFGKLIEAITREREDQSVDGVELMQKAISRLEEQIVGLERTLRRTPEPPDERPETDHLRRLTDRIFDLTLKMYWLTDAVSVRIHEKRGH